MRCEWPSLGVDLTECFVIASRVEGALPHHTRRSRWQGRIRPVATPQGSGRVVRRAGRTSQTATGTPSAARGPVMAKLARLEREASSCNDGCESSFKRGKDPWVGCSELAGYYSVFSATCKDTLTHRDYAQCVETKMFLGWDRQRSWWYCTACWLGGNFGSPQRIETGSALELRLNSGQLNHVSFVFGQPDRNVVAANTISIQGSIPPDQSST